MVRFTHKGSEALERKISDDLSCIVATLKEMPEGSHWKNIILLGGYGRKEGTTLVRGDKEYPFNDYDLIVVTDRASFFQRQAMQKKLDAVCCQLTKELQLPVEMYLHTFQSLKQAEPSLMNYELKHGHHCLHGDEDYIDLLMPHYDSSDVPLSEGTRLLLNRGVLLMYCQHHLFGNSELEKSDIERYYKFINKAHLAMGDCLFLEAGQYNLSYQIKKMAIEMTNHIGRGDEIPIEWIQKMYLKSIAFKEKACFEGIDKGTLLNAFNETLTCYLTFYKWYESKRLNIPLSSMQEHSEAILCSNEPRGHRQLLLNLRLFGMRAAQPSPMWSLIHPRNRLYVVLPSLLEGTLSQSSPYLANMLGCSEDRNSLTQRFIQLRKRLS